MSSRTKEASVNNNKSWDDVLACYDIQNQEYLGFDEPQADAVCNETAEKGASRWTGRAAIFVGCATALGNIPLQSFLPNTADSQFEIALEHGESSASPVTTNDEAKPAPAVQAASVKLATHAADKQQLLVNNIDGDAVLELPLPKRALETYTGHQLINPESTWYTHTVQRYDNLHNTFTQVRQAAILDKLRGIEPIREALKDIKMGTIVRAKSFNGKLEQLAFTPDNKRSFVIKPDGKGSFSGQWQEKVFEVRQARATFVVKNGLFLDGKRVDVPNNIIRQVVSVFDWDIDFSHDVRVGDQVTVVYENIYHDGDLVGSQNLLAAEFINKGKIHRTIRHTTERGLTDFFTPEGREMKRAFIRTPVEHARVSSHFNPGRFHPVLHKIRSHKGTDFAARRGTPIIATGDGEVQFKGRKGGYGNTIILKHREGYTTLYAHMSKFKKNLKQGQIVAQGDVIGYVGSTGLATGPHLHYEFRKNNIPADPMTVRLPNSMSLTKKELVKFKADAINMKLQLNVLHRFAMENFDINSATGG